MSIKIDVVIRATDELLEVLRDISSALAGAKSVCKELVIAEAAPLVQAPAQVPMAPVQAAVPTAQPPVQAPAPATVPTATTTYTMDQLAVAATQLMDAGRRGDLLGLLSAFGVQALTMLPKEQYGAFATKLRELGAKL
jgi:hypothetical protein